MKKLRVIICLLICAVLVVCGTPQQAKAESESVYLGGFSVGISLDIGGLLVESVSGVETEYGLATVDGLRRGDIIRRIDGTEVKRVSEMQELLLGKDCVTVRLLRDGDELDVEVKPITEIYSNKPRLGIKVKEKIYGVGTVTFVRQNGRYAALGHEIYDSETDTHIPICDGKIHACKIIGVKQGKKGEAGAILASIIADSVYGTVNCNNNFGISGHYDCDKYKDEIIEIADRSEVKPGAAQIRTTIDNKPEYFDVEIIKASHQSGRKEKGIVFRVTDKRLLDLTGGVVRGMSGSPIIQNGKLVGAVTHVFLNDFTKGYGVYADCLNK